MDIDTILQRGVEKVIDERHLWNALKSRKKLRVKLGIDPTKPDLHFGHAVPLRKLHQFQVLGHTVVLIIGDFTATIGDPSGRSEERAPLSASDVRRNMKTYLSQASEFIDVKKAEVHYNSTWFKKPNVIAEIAGKVSMQQLLEREDFKERIREGSAITAIEALYPLFQGYDSVMVNADVEVGGTDQMFNLLMGRRLQRAYKMPEQDIILLPLVEGTDGNRKMSKSYGNYIALRDTPSEMFGKTMSIPDILIKKYHFLLTDTDAPSDVSPREQKLKLAHDLVAIIYGETKAKKAEHEFVTVFSHGGLPSSIPIFGVSRQKMPLLELLLETQLAKTKSDARRLVTQHGVRVNHQIKEDPNEVLHIHTGDILQVGKRKFLKLTN